MCPAALQQHRAKCRAEGQGVDRGNQHRRRHRHRELAEQLAADPRDERDRHEHRQQHEGDGDDRSGDLGHRFLGRRRDRQLRFFLDHPLDILDHDDRIIDYEAD